MKSLLRHLFGLMVGIALANGALAQVPMTGTGNYVQDFNSLVNTGTGTWVNGGATPSIPNFYAQRTGTGTSIAANNGASNAGNLYSYGTGTNVDRSLGSLGSGNAAAGNFAWGIELRNTGTAAITDMTVSYTGEQWRNSAAAAQTVSFYYRVSASSNTDLNPNVTTGWTAVPALNFTSPITGGTAGALDGNAAANRIAFSAVAIVGINVPAGSYLMFKWDDPDQTGADHGVSIDDLTITWGSGPADVPPTVTTVVPANGAVGVAENTNIDLTFSEAVTATGNWVTVTGSLSGARTPASGLTVTGGPTTFTLDPDTDFTLGETVTVTVTAANVADQDGTPNNLAADFTSSFTVVPPVTTIAAAKAQPFGSLVAVTGVVTVANQFGGQVFIQDATGGIGIFDNTAPFLNEDPALLIGRELTVQGTLSEFQPTTGVPGSGLTQISPVTSYTIGATVGVPAPKVVTMNGLTEADEAVLVQVNNVAIPERGLVIPNSSYNGVDATGPGVLRIQNTTFSNLGILGQVLPARSSAVVGVLGQFRGTYQVQPRLPGDIAGAGAASPSFGSTPESETLDVITINAEWFGHPSNGPGGTAPGTADAQRTAMTTLLNNLQADVYFLQEVNNVAQFNTLVANMPGYAARLVTDCFSNRPASPTAAEIDEGQKLAFIYKTSVITPDAAVNGGQPLCYLSSFSVPADYPAPFGTLATADPGRFWASGRFPVVFVVDATVNGVTRKLHLINIHARANGGGAEALERYAMRRFDFNALYTQLAIDYPNANIVMAGDYNDDVDVTVSDNPLNGTTTLADFMNDPTNYRVVTYPLSLDKWRSFASQFNMIDHITVSNELFDNQLVKTELVVDGYSILPTTRFHSTVTDHLPVKARLSLADIPTWNGTAWSPAAPVANQNARINGNFNTATDGNGLAPGNLTINSPATLTIAENNSFTVNGILSYPGNLTVQSGGSLVQAAGSTLGTTTGTFSALRAVGTKPAPGYNFISSPVAGATFNGIGSSPNPDRFFRYDPTVLPVGQNQWVALPGTSTLLPGVGYTFVSDAGANTLTFTGLPNNGDINLTLTGVAGSLYHVVGNPYPSPLRLSALFNDNNNLTTGISGTAWFWQDDNNGTGTGNFTAVNGVTNPTAQAAVGQSFYVLANGTSGILAFTNAQRQAGNPVFYREEGEPMERLRLEVTGAGTRDELWAAFAPSFTQGFERGYDAEKLEGDTRLSLSAVTAHGRLAVAALPPATTGQFELPLQLMARQAGTYTFAASLVQSGGRNLALEDRQTGQLYHLQPGQAHTLALAAGTYRDRFYLREAGTGPQNNTQAGEAAHAYAFGRELFVAAGAEAEVRVYNLLGVELARFAGVPPGGPRRLAVGVPAPGVYVVKVATASGTVQQRVWLEH